METVTVICGHLQPEMHRVTNLGASMAGAGFKETDNPYPLLLLPDYHDAWYNGWSWQRRLAAKKVG